MPKKATMYTRVCIKCGRYFSTPRKSYKQVCDICNRQGSLSWKKNKVTTK